MELPPASVPMVAWNWGIAHQSLCFPWPQSFFRDKHKSPSELLGHEGAFLQISEAKADCFSLCLKPEGMKNLKLLSQSSHEVWGRGEHIERLRKGRVILNLDDFFWTLMPALLRSFLLYKCEQFPSCLSQFRLAFLLLATKKPSWLRKYDRYKNKIRVNSQTARTQASSPGRELSATRAWPLDIAAMLPLNRT